MLLWGCQHIVQPDKLPLSTLKALILPARCCGAAAGRKRSVHRMSATELPCLQPAGCCIGFCLDLPQAC